MSTLPHFIYLFHCITSALSGNNVSMVSDLVKLHLPSVMLSTYVSDLYTYSVHSKFA